MKLLLVTTDYPPTPGGVARYYSQLVAAMGSSVEVLVPKLSTWMWPAWLGWIKELRQAFVASRADAIWVGQVLPVGTVALILKCLGGPRYVVSTHGMDILSPLASSWKRWLATRVLRNAALVTTNSQFTSQQLSNNYGIAESKVCIVYPSASLSAVGGNTKLDIPETAQLIVCVGRLVQRKGFDLALKALPDVWKTRPEAHLAIMGSGPELVNLQKLAASLDRPAQVHFFANPDDALLASAYARASALVFPARQHGADVEGFGIVCLEAAAAGVPVVATATGGIAEAVQDGKTGLLIEPDNPKALASAILRIVDDSSLRNRMSGAAKLWAAQFSWQKSATKFLEAVERSV